VKHLSYIFNLTKFAFKENRLLYLSIVISLLSVVIELIALSSLLPLLEIVSKNHVATEGMIIDAFSYFKVEVNAANLLKAFTALLLARIITQFISQNLSLYLGRKVMAQLASGAFHKIMNYLSLEAIEEKSIGFFINLAGDEAFRASTIIISITQILSTFFLSLLYFLAIVNYSLNLSLSVIGFMCLVAVFLRSVFKLMHKYGEKQIEESRSATSTFLDSLNNIKAIRALLAGNYATTLYKQKIFNYSRTLFLVDQAALLTRTTPIIILLLLLGSYQAIFKPSLNNEDISFIVTIIVYMMRLFPTVGQCLNLLMRLITDSKIGKDITEIIGIPEDKSIATSQLRDPIKKIEFKKIHFSYSKKPERVILKNLSLTLTKGRSYAITGKSGLGKSTLIDLLLKFYQPTGGQVFINQHNIADLSTEQIRQRIILVNQEPAIFDDTIRNNISMGSAFADKALKDSCEQAAIDEMIQSFTDKYDHRVNYQGKNLSGGQRQRIAIARALIRHPEVLIFDESTSALDKATQNQILQSILRNKSDKIIVFITHDPEIMGLVDEVIDIETINH